MYANMGIDNKTEAKTRNTHTGIDYGVFVKESWLHSDHSYVPVASCDSRQVILAGSDVTWAANSTIQAITDTSSKCLREHFLKGHLHEY